MKHNSPQGPQPTGVAIFGQFPVLWARLSGEQILGLDLPGEWVLGLDLSLGGHLTPSSLLLLPHCCKYFNKMEKKKKKKKRKSHHLKPPGACGPASPGLSPEQSGATGPWQPGLLRVCVHPQPGVGGPPEQLFTIQRQKTKSRSNSETKNLFPSRHRFCRLFPCSACSLASVSPPGACTSLPAPGLGPVSPSPPHGPRGGTLTPKDAFAKMAALSL